MPQPLERTLILNIDGLEIRSPAKITANITKDVSSNAPDSAQVTIYNLSEETRTKVTKAKKIEISAGYREKVEVVFLGDIQAVLSKKEQTEWTTQVFCGDGATAMKQAIINKTYTKPLKAKELIEDISRTSGLANDIEFMDGIEDTKGTLRGSVRNGKATREIDRICRARGWKWNLQNEKLVVSQSGKSRTDNGYLISVETGMIGSPEWLNVGQDTSKEPEKKLTVEALCIPSIKPNDKVRVISGGISGRIGSFTYNTTRANPLDAFFCVESVTHNLDSREGSFSTSLDCLYLQGGG